MPIRAALQIQSGLECPVAKMSEHGREVTVLNPMYLPHWIEINRGNGTTIHGESTRRLKRSRACSSCELVPLCRGLGVHITRFKAIDGHVNIEVVATKKSYGLFLKQIFERYRFDVYGVTRISSRRRGTGLTPLRLGAVRLAMAQGYYDFPRRASLETIAEQLGRSPSTIDEHLRRAEKSMLEAFLDNRVSEFIGPNNPLPGQRYVQSSIAKENEFLASVFDSDRRIRMCVIKDKDGKIVAGGMRQNVASFEPSSEAHRLAHYEAVQRRMADSWNGHFGESDYVIEHRKRLVAFKFFLPGSRMVVVTTEPDYPIQKTGLLLEIVGKFKAEA
jgi:hypothetical protein